MNRLVSVVMPAYNCDKYIRESIHSILAQSYTNFELIIWDDGSTDATVNQIKTITDSRIILYQNFENKGYPVVMNSLFGVVSGEFVMIQDADDLAQPDRIKKLAELLEANPAYDLIGSHLIKFYSDKNRKNVHSELSAYKLNQSFINYSRPDITFATLMMRRNVTEIPFRNLMFITRAQDIDWLFRVSEKHLLMNGDAYLYCYRQHDQSMSNDNKLEHLYNYFFWDYICFITQFRRKRNTDLLQPAYESQLLDFLNVLIKRKKATDPVFWERHLAYRSRRNGHWLEAIAYAMNAIKSHPFKRSGYQCLYKILSRNFQ